MDRMHPELSGWESSGQIDEAHTQLLTNRTPNPHPVGDGEEAEKEHTDQNAPRIPDFDVSAPPPGTYQFPTVSLSSHQKVGLHRFSRPDVLPPHFIPRHAQVLWFVYRWTNWAAAIESDHRREKVLDWISDVTQKAMDKELEQSLNTAEPEVLSNKKPPKKRKTNSSQELVIVSKTSKNSAQYAVRLSELIAHDIDIESLKEKVKAQDLQHGEELLEKAVRCYGGSIKTSHWLYVCGRSSDNPLGRDLLIYALFEVQRSRDELSRLKSMQAGFAKKQQKQNTQHRITAEQERHDLFLALAIELYKKRPTDEDDGLDPDLGQSTGEDEDSEEEAADAMRVDVCESPQVVDGNVRMSVESPQLEAQKFKTQDADRYENFSPDISISDDQQIEESSLSCQPVEPEIGEPWALGQVSSAKSSEPLPDGNFASCDLTVHDGIDEGCDEGNHGGDEKKADDSSYEQSDRKSNENKAKEKTDERKEETTEGGSKSSLIVKLITCRKSKPLELDSTEVTPAPDQSSEQRQTSQEPKTTIRLNLRNRGIAQEKKLHATKKKPKPSKPDRKQQKKKTGKRKAKEALDSDSDYHPH